MNIRELANLNPNYFQINREERNYAAILYSALCKPENALKFLAMCGVQTPTLGPDFGIYFEYSFIRDLWYHVKENDTRKRIIGGLLKINDIQEILNLPFVDLNRKFGVSGKPSANYVESPGNWAITKFSENFPDNDDFKKICMFKWSFNIKPDIVIHIDKDNALCIEAKYESKEGKYPSSRNDQEIFTARKLSQVTQTELQKYMMEELLGIKTKFMFLVSKKTSSETHHVISWAEAFDSVGLDGFPEFAKQMAERISKQNV